MRHKIKCLEKRSYFTTDEAKVSIKDIYLKKGKLLSVYECPICLDFHLTKIINNRVLNRKKLQAEFRKEALRAWFPKWNRLATATIMDRANRAMLIHLGLKKPKIKITGTKEKNTLSLARQKEIYAQLV